MAKKKAKNSFNLEELKEIQRKLCTRKGKVIDEIVMIAVTTIDLEASYTLRELSAQLVHILTALKFVAGDSQKMAELMGEAVLPVDLAECGIEV